MQGLGRATPRMANRIQILVILVLTVALTAVAIAGGKGWIYHPKSIVFAAGPEGTPAQLFAGKLASLVEENSRTLRISVATQTAAETLSLFSRLEADLAIIRTDTRIPGNARAVAILEHDDLLIMTARATKLKDVASLKGKTLTILASDARNEVLVRKILDVYEVAGPGTTIQAAGPDADLDKALAAGGVVLALEPLSRIAATKRFEELAKKPKGLGLIAVSGSKVLERKIPGLFSETLEAGLVSASPRLPDEDLDTVGVQHVLVARNKVSNAAVAAITRTIFENKAALAAPDFATKIEPPDVDKDAFIPAHPGAAEYVNDEVKNVVDRYSDLVYLALTIGSVIGSLFLGLYSAVTRVSPVRAGALASATLAVAEDIRAAKTLQDLDRAETRLREILGEVLGGLRDGTVSSQGLEAFRLGYEHARDALSLQRDLLADADRGRSASSLSLEG